MEQAKQPVTADSSSDQHISDDFVSDDSVTDDFVTDQEYLKKVLLSPVYDVARRTDLQCLEKFSAAMGNEVWLKREDQQPVKSFKLRGAYNCIA